MPINKSLYKSLIKKYGIIKAKKIYAGMERDNKSTFKKGLKTAKKEGHILKHFPKKRVNVKNNRGNPNGTPRSLNGEEERFY